MTERLRDHESREERKLTTKTTLMAALGAMLIATSFSAPLQAQEQWVEGWNLHKSQDPQLTLLYYNAVEDRIPLAVTCAPHDDEAIFVYYPPSGTLADEQSHEVWLHSESNTYLFYGPYRETQGQVLIFALGAQSRELIGLFRTGFTITVDDTDVARLETRPEQAAIVEELIAGCWP